MSGGRTWFIVLGATALIAIGIVLGVHFSNSGKTAQIQQYPLTGSVLEVRQDAKKVAVRNENIPGFMQSMVMDYDLKDPSLLSTLRPGDQIRATLLTDNEHQWILDNVTVTGKK